MAKNYGVIDAARHRLGQVENALVDELLAGRVNRRDFLRHGSVLGVSLPLLGSLAAAVGLGVGPSRAFAASSPGGTVRAAVSMPNGAIDPVTYHDSGSYQLVFQVAEFLCVTQPDLTLKPVLAVSWTHNEDGTIWTFNLRKGVKFHNGQEMKADDVVATFDRLSDPEGKSNALSVFKGLLSKGGTKKVDEHTVAFHLDAPNGNFPYSLSIDNYNAVILPANYDGNYEASFPEPDPSGWRNIRPRSARLSSATPITGGRKPFRIASSSSSTTISSRVSSPSRPARSTSSMRSPSS